MPSSRRSFIFLFVTLALLVCSGLAAPADYGTKVHFEKGKPIDFPDFTLTYLGERKVAMDKFPRPFVHQEFRIVSGGSTITVGWSAGTGDIGPTNFKLGEKNFALELKRSDKLGRLREGEVVINRVP